MTSHVCLASSCGTLITLFKKLYHHCKVKIYKGFFWIVLFVIPISAGLHTQVIAQLTLLPPPSLEKLEIVTSRGTYVFSVEVARTDEDRERGLMFRGSLGQDRGMLFDFAAEQVVMMWMKNTYLALDMIFISSGGKVVAVAKNAAPLSEKIISSGVPAAGVLEVNAGTAARIGLRVGDNVRHPIFSR